VRGLRESRTRHRGFWPGVLIPGLRAALFAAALALLAGCSGRAADSPRTDGVAWLQLQSGAFRPVTDPWSTTKVARQPWTVQARVADMAFFNDTLYCALNGSGLASLEKDPTGAVQFSYHEDPLIFGHRTITTLVPRQGSLAIHLYFNALLNDARRQDLSIAGISLVAYVPKQTDYTFLIPPFQRKNPDWESVGFATESENSFDFAWKYTDASETRFEYTRYHADTNAEEQTDRSTFLAALGIPAIEGPAVPSTLAAFFAACRAEITSLPRGGSIQFSLRSRKSPVRRNYRSLKESESALAVPVFEEQGTLLALLPDGRLLQAGPGGTPQTRSLPRLPQEFRYTDIVKWGSSLVLPWEEVSFTDVGRAGILVYPVVR
jgi:hypothetical protein